MVYASTTHICNDMKWQVHNETDPSFSCCYRGNPYGFYQRALISNAATSALRLHQRLPHFQFSREFFAMLFLEDSCHYLMFSLIFMNGYPITSILIESIEKSLFYKEMNCRPGNQLVFVVTYLIGITISTWYKWMNNCLQNYFCCIFIFNIFIEG